MIQTLEQRQLSAQVRAFNLAFRPGDSCVIQRDGKDFETLVDSPAKIVSGNRAVATFRGYEGWYDIVADTVRGVST